MCVLSPGHLLCVRRHGGRGLHVLQQEVLHVPHQCAAPRGSAHALRVRALLTSPTLLTVKQLDSNTKGFCN